MAKDPLKKEQPAPAPYEDNHKLVPLVFVVTVINDHQSYAIVDLLNQQEAAIACIMHARGTAPSHFYEVVGFDGTLKQVVVAILKQDKWPAYKLALQERFAVSPYAKGIAFTIPIDAVAGVSIYKMLANMQVIDRPIKPKKSLIGGKKA